MKSVLVRISGETARQRTKNTRTVEKNMLYQKYQVTEVYQ
jgi:hypothetical protein